MSGKFALIIGNTEYTDPGLAQLTAPGKDAEDFARVLKDTEIGAFDQVNIVLNQSSSASIEAIDEFFDQRMPDDLLVLYFSGHGVRDELGALYLAVKNTIRSRLRSTAIKSDYIREAMDQSRSKRQVVILDCCNSGAFSQGMKAEVGGTMGMVSAFKGYGRYVLTASDEIQFAWEGDQIIGKTNNSLFTHFLLKGLEGEADSNSDGRITVDELYNYAFHQISKLTPKQTPRLDAWKQEGEIVLRQNMRIEDIKPVALPNELLDEIEDTRPYVREAAVQKLEKILKGRNIGLARSATEELEKIVNDEDTTPRVSQVATQVLESYKQTLQNAEEERATKLEAQRLGEETRRTDELAEAERKAKEDAERLATLKVEEERITKAKLEAEQKTKVEKAKVEPASKFLPIAISSFGLLIIFGIMLFAIIIFMNIWSPDVTQTPTKRPASIAAQSTSTFQQPASTPISSQSSPTTDSIIFPLEVCSTSSEDICLYAYNPQPTSLIITFIFKEDLRISNLPILSVEGEEFQCTILENFPGRLYCSGPPIAGNLELVVSSSTGEIITSGTFYITKYVVPAPTPRNGGGGSYP